MTTILEGIFFTHYNVTIKIHMVVKICISMMVMRDMESSSRAKRKYVGQNDAQSL